MKRLGLLLLIIGISLSGWSQERKFFSEVGIVAGAGFGDSHYLGGTGSWNATLAYIFGIEVTVFKISEKSSVRSGIIFAKQDGPNYKKSIESYNEYGESYHIWSDGVTSLYYMNIPILYQFKSKGGFYLEGGIQAGILLSAKQEVTDSNGADAKDNFKTFEFSVPVGIGYWFNERLSVGVRTINGLTNMNSTKVQEEVYDVTDRSSILLGVVRFNF